MSHVGNKLCLLCKSMHGGILHALVIIIYTQSHIIEKAMVTLCGLDTISKTSSLPTLLCSDVVDQLMIIYIHTCMQLLTSVSHRHSGTGDVKLTIMLLHMH